MFTTKYGTVYFHWSIKETKRSKITILGLSERKLQYYYSWNNVTIIFYV